MIGGLLFVFSLRALRGRNISSGNANSYEMLSLLKLHWENVAKHDFLKIHFLPSSLPLDSCWLVDKTVIRASWFISHPKEVGNGKFASDLPHY